MRKRAVAAYARSLAGFALFVLPAAAQVRIIPATASYTDSQGNVWSSDASYQTGGGIQDCTTHAITGTLPSTTDQALYQCERWGNAVRETFSVPNGSYTVLAKFSENNFDAVGDRVFNVTVNGAAWLTDFDIFATTGGKFKATDQTFPTPVGVINGQIVVVFTKITNYAKYDALSIIPVSTLATPSIASLSPMSGTPGTLVTITGTNFGATQGSSKVAFNGTAATPTSWSATSIMVPVPSGATTGNVEVIVAGVASNGVSFAVGSVLTPAITLVQHPQTTDTTCSTAVNTCTLTVASTGSGHFGVVTIALHSDANNWVTGITDNHGGTWTVPGSAGSGGCYLYSGVFGTTGCGYNLTLPAGVTSITATWNSVAAKGARMDFREYSYTGGSIQLDNIGAYSDPSTAVTTITGISPVLSGTNDVIIQSFSSGSSSATGVTTYGDANIADNLYASADLLNTTATVAPTFTTCCAKALYGAIYIAFKLANGVPQAATPVCTPGTGSYNSAQAVSCTNPSSAPVLCYTTNGATPVTNGATGCTTGIVVAGPISITATGTTLQVVAGGTGFTNSSPASDTYTLTIGSTPAISGLSETSGPVGTFITIAGSNFGASQGASTVTFDGTAGAPLGWSATSIVVPVPNGATTGPIMVSVNGLASNGVTFTVVPLQLPTQAQVLAAIKNANNYWIANNSPGNADWDQATYFTGDLAAYDATGESNYLTFAQTWATNNSYSLCGTACGEGPGGNTTTFADYQAAGQVYIRLYQLTNTAPDLTGITESISGMVNSTVDNEWTWIDAINMSMPDFVDLGSITNDTNYYTKMYALYSYAKYTVGLYDSKTGLWWENATYVNTNEHWSRGNGWVFAAHAKVLSVLPTSDPHYAEYLSTFTTMAQALAACQQPGGYWNQDLTGTDIAGPESSGTSFFLYGLAWGLNNGVLDQATYLPVTEKAWNFLANTAIQPSGLLGYVQPAVVGSSPPSATSTADFGVGAFLLAAPQVALLVQ